jgi:hypothetical protein
MRCLDVIHLSPPPHAVGYTSTENKCTRIAVRPCHWITFNTALIQFMQHDGNERRIYQTLIRASLFLKRETT